MYFRLIVLTILLSVSNSLWAGDTNLTINGLVKDEVNTPVSYATVSIHKISDSSSVLSSFTEENGTFKLEIQSGDYYLKIDFLGTITKYIKIAKTTGNINLGTIILSPDKSNELAETVIVGQKNQMTLQIDKRVYNVDADITSKGGNAADVLQNIPSVSVDPDGNVSLRGNQNVRILVNGKESGFTSTADALQQLQASMIDKVEIITNPSARYDAQGQVGIINIVLKKDAKKGFNASIFVKTGYNWDNGIGFNANYKKGKTNYFGSLSLNQRRVIGKSHTYQWLKNTDTAFYYEQDYKHDRRMIGANASFGVEYSIDSLSSITGRINVRTGSGDNAIYRTYNNYTYDQLYVSTQQRDESNTSPHSMLEGSLDYTKKFGLYDGKWETSIDFFKDQDNDKSNFTETSTLDTSTALEKSNDNTIEQNLQLQSDLVLPFSKNTKMETGIKAQMKDINNLFGYSQLLNGNWEAPAMYNDKLDYNEKVYAAYVMGSHNIGKWGAQAGLRAEYSKVTTQQQSQPSTQSRDYFNLFPSIALSYKHSDITTFQMSYSRRIDRPGQWDLLPYRHFGDDHAMRIGNPNLNPELTGSYEISMLNVWQNGSLLSSAYYRHTKDKFSRISYLGNDGVVYSQSMNIALSDAYGLEFNANYSPTKWLKLTTGFNFFKENITGSYANVNYDESNFSWSNRTSINVNIIPNWKLQLNGNYMAPQVMPQGKRLAMYFMDFGMAKDILKGKATLSFNLMDILNSRKWRSETSTPTIQSQTDFMWRQRSARLVFTYRINQQRKRAQSDNIIDNSGGGNNEQ